MVGFAGSRPPSASVPSIPSRFFIRNGQDIVIMRIEQIAVSSFQHRQKPIEAAERQVPIIFQCRMEIHRVHADDGGFAGSNRLFSSIEAYLFIITVRDRVPVQKGRCGRDEADPACQNGGRGLEPGPFCATTMPSSDQLARCRRSPDTRAHTPKPAPCRTSVQISFSPRR